MFGAIELILIVVVGGGLIVGITLWITGGKSSGKGEMSCGGCGYAVRGLNGLNCPECGADLRMVGINRPSRGGSRGIGIAITVGTLFVLVTCMGSAFWLFSAKSVPSSPATPSQSAPSVLKSTPVQPTPAGPDLAAPEDDTDESSTPGDLPASDEPSP